MATDARRPWLDHYDPGVPSDIAVPNEPLFAMLDEAARKHPRRVAVRFANTRLRYRRLHALSETIAANLRNAGVKPGDRVAVMLPNLPQTVAIYFGILKAGGIVVMTNPLYKQAELTHHFADCGARHLIALDRLWPVLSPLVQQLGLSHLWYTGVEDGLTFPLSWAYLFKTRNERRAYTPDCGDHHGCSVRRWKDLARGRIRYSRPYDELDPDETALLQYTGGTTGVSKGCMLTHRTMLANIRQIETLLPGVGRDVEVFLGVLPYFHVYGLTLCLNFAVRVAATLAPLPRFDPAEVLHTIEKLRPTIFPGAPSVYMALMQQKRFATTDVTSLRYCVSGSAPMPLAWLERFERETGSVLLEGYGLTEASPVTHVNPLTRKRKPGTIGLPLPGTDARVVDAEGGACDVPPGKRGELIIRGPQVMTGYWNRPEETASTIRDGWLYTGDIAVMDEEGYFSIVDRKKDMVLTGGYNVYPREIDEVLTAHPGVREGVAVGVPSRTRGEQLAAYVVLHPAANDNTPPTPAELIAWCRERLANYKVPRRVIVREELPKTLVGKVLRRALREEWEQDRP